MIALALLAAFLVPAAPASARDPRQTRLHTRPVSDDAGPRRGGEAPGGGPAASASGGSAAKAADASDRSTGLPSASRTPVAGDGSASTEALFIDTSIPESRLLADSVRPGVDVVPIAPALGIVRTIAVHLLGHPGVRVVHVVTHGEPGRVVLRGGTSISADTLDLFESDLRFIGEALGPGGEILLYGCDVGRGDVGSEFVDALAGATGCAVAASTNPTGAAAKGGDWALEKRTGTVTAESPFSAAARDAYRATLQVELTCAPNGSVTFFYSGPNGSCVSGAPTNGFLRFNFGSNCNLTNQDPISIQNLCQCCPVFNQDCFRYTNTNPSAVSDVFVIGSTTYTVTISAVHLVCPAGGSVTFFYSGPNGSCVSGAPTNGFLRFNFGSNCNLTNQDPISIQNLCQCCPIFNQDCFRYTNTSTSATLDQFVIGNTAYVVAIGGSVPVIGTNPTNQSANCNQSVSFSASASGTPSPTVQWQRSTDGGTTFHAIFGATSTTYSHTAASSENGYQYRAVFSSASGAATTTAATLSILSPFPSIAASATVCAGSTGNTATTTAVGPYAWTITGGTITSAANIQTVTYTAGASGTVTLRLTTGTGLCAAAASPASVTIVARPTITAPTTACANQTGVTATGSVAGTWSITNGTITGGQGTSTVTFTAGASGTVGLSLTAGGCSGTASVPINGSPGFGQHPTDQTACLGATATFTASATGTAPLTYQWYRGTTMLTDGAKYGGTTTSTLSVFDAGPADEASDYNVVVTGCGSQATSNPASLTINPNGCFDSQFAAGSDPTRDWTNDMASRGAWSLDGTGNYATATASSSGLSSISHVGNYGSFDYRVDWVRTGTCATCPTSLYIRGVPQPVQPPYQRWFSCYQFSVTGDGRYSVWLYNGTGAAVAVQPWTPLVGVAINAAPAANWLQVTIDPAQPTMMHFVVNGVEVAMVPTNGVLTSGQVGVSMMRNTTVPGGLAEVLKVDRARLGPHNALPAKAGEAGASPSSPASSEEQTWWRYRRLSTKQRRVNREAQRAYELHPELGGSPDEPPALTPAN